MMLCVYAITDHPGQPLPAQPGLNDAPLAQRVHRDIAAVVSACGDAHPSASADDLWRYEEVLESLMCDRTVLPVRFATLAPSWQHVGDMLCAAYAAFVQDIERVRGTVEIGMRFLTASEHGGAAETASAHVESAAVCSPDGNAPASSNGLGLPGTGPGSAYLSVKLASARQLRDRRRAKVRLVRGVYERLASHANASRLDDEADDRQATAAAFLVPADRIASFQEIVGEVANANPQLALICTGPWPPYSFVNAGETATR
jgi:Gas vesicle synthesis protein GvpL/GvpF